MNLSNLVNDYVEILMLGGFSLILSIILYLSVIWTKNRTINHIKDKNTPYSNPSKIAGIAINSSKISINMGEIKPNIYDIAI